MRRMLIQVHKNSVDKSVTRLLGILMRLSMVKSIHIQKGTDRNKFTNITISARGIKILWDALSPTIRQNKVLRQCTIVLCEGKCGWDDYEYIYGPHPEQIDPKWR